MCLSKNKDCKAGCTMTQQQCLQKVRISGDSNRLTAMEDLLSLKETVTNLSTNPTEKTVSPQALLPQPKNTASPKSRSLTEEEGITIMKEAGLLRYPNA